MSDISIISKNGSFKTKSATTIKNATYFTGRIGRHNSKYFFKAYDCIVCLKTGDFWGGNPDIEHYQECDVEIALTPVN